MSTERDETGERPQFPRACPACQQQTGVPRSATTVAGEPFKVRLSMHCPLCQHHWTYDKINERVGE